MSTREDAGVRKDPWTEDQKKQFEQIPDGVIAGYMSGPVALTKGVAITAKSRAIRSHEEVIEYFVKRSSEYQFYMYEIRDMSHLDSEHKYIIRFAERRRNEGH